MSIVAVMVNFKTEHLIRQAVESFRKFYPETTLLVIDNGSEDGSTQYVASLNGNGNTATMLLPHNIGHGPALDYAISFVTASLVFTMDSDCVVNKGGFLEAMSEHFSDPDVYAVGWLRHVNRLSGVPEEWHLKTEHIKGQFVPYLHPAAALYDVVKYRQLSPFIHHGAPCLPNMLDAERHGYKCVEFSIFGGGYITHLVGGTRRMFPSEQGDWNPQPGVEPRPWVANVNIPI